MINFIYYLNNIYIQNSNKRKSHTNLPNKFNYTIDTINAFIVGRYEITPSREFMLFFTIVENQFHLKDVNKY